MDRAEKPGPGVGPVAFGGRRGYVERLGAFLESETDKVAQLDQLRLARVVRGEGLERLVDGEKLVVLLRRPGDFDFVRGYI